MNLCSIFLFEMHLFSIKKNYLLTKVNEFGNWPVDLSAFRRKNLFITAFENTGL